VGDMGRMKKNLQIQSIEKLASQIWRGLTPSTSLVLGKRRAAIFAVGNSYAIPSRIIVKKKMNRKTIFAEMAISATSS
jgi:hypothetical protein